MRTLIGVAALVVLMGSHDKPVFAVAPTSLNNLSANPDTHADMAVMPVLTLEAQARLAACGFQVVAKDSAPNEAGRDPSYLFEHGDEAANWGAAHHADWVLVGRLNRIGRWEADWEIQVVSVSERRVIDTRVVELKGFGLDSALTAKLANRGAAWLVDQVTQSVAHANGSATDTRPCHA